VELARPLAAEAAEKSSALTALRLQRKLTIEEAAKRAALWPEQVEWLEESRLYRFPSTETAVLALLRYATALGIDHRQARALSGMPVEPPARRPVGRWIAAGAVTAIVAAVALALTVGLDGGGPSAKSRAASLPPPWKYAVDVLNGSGDINYTRQIASRVGAFGYRIQHVTKANRFDYRETAVYYEPGGATAADRLAKQIGCGTPKPLPGGTNPRRLVVIVGAAHATC
jgi:LytR cell envelope-related transcriptional attenuator/Helix-turn-helix domain